MPVNEIYEEASRLSLEITAPCYNLLFFYLQEKGGVVSEERTEDFMRKQDEVFHFFLRHPQYILFRWNANCNGVLVKAEGDQIEEWTRKGVEHIRSVCDSEEEHLDWYVAIGSPVERLSMLPSCYQDVNHYLAYRFMIPSLHVLSKTTLSDYLTTRDENRIDGVESSAMSQEIIRDFLVKGNSSEIHDFVESYLDRIKEPLRSRMFRAYVVLNIRFTILAYVESIGVSKEEFMEQVGNHDQDMNMEASEVPEYFLDMLQTAINIRENESSNQNRKILRKALEYIDKNYDKESMSLNQAAAKLYVSANYLSTVFSQNMKKTFVEYVTGKRMEKAKKLLKNTTKSAGEIAQEVGYKDSHYFSFVFKKTQGCSPREYRSGKKGQADRQADGQ